MVKIIGDIFDDIGCWFARYELDSLASFFHKISGLIDPDRIQFCETKLPQMGPGVNLL